MKSPPIYSAILVSLLGMALLQPITVLSAESASQEQSVHQGAKGNRIQPMLAEGVPVSLVYVHLEKSTGDSGKDDELKRQVADAFGQAAGEVFREFTADMRLKKVCTEKPQPGRQCVGATNGCVTRRGGHAGENAAVETAVSGEIARWLCPP